MGDITRSLVWSLHVFPCLLGVSLHKTPIKKQAVHLCFLVVFPSRMMWVLGLSPWVSMGAYTPTLFSPRFWTFQYSLNQIDKCEINRPCYRTCDAYQFGLDCSGKPGLKSVWTHPMKWLATASGLGQLEWLKDWDRVSWNGWRTGVNSTSYRWCIVCVLWCSVLLLTSAPVDVWPINDPQGL